MTTYILYNTLIYGSIAFIIASYYAYAKFLNATIWSYMIIWSYVTITMIKYGFSWASLWIIAGMIAFYFIVNLIVIKSFSNEKQRDLFGLIFTLWGALIIENMVNILYWPNAISVELRTRTSWWLAITLAVISIVTTYIFHISYNGKIWQAIYAQASSVRSLWVRIDRMLTILMSALLPCMVLIGVIVANEWAIKPSDNLFYLIKWIGIMIMVWVEKKQYVYLWALIYVIIEYILFIKIGLPIGFKETLILCMILLILLIKPEGLFSLRSRKM
jgi:branched-subunit amino acid ABC-type transport system permease component